LRGNYDLRITISIIGEEHWNLGGLVAIARFIEQKLRITHYDFDHGRGWNFGSVLAIARPHAPIRILQVPERE
jgi:hypothetical protein